MVDLVQVFVFGDQSYDASELMFRLLHTHDDIILSSFLDSCFRTLQLEVADLKDEQRLACPRFSKLADLLPHWRNGTLNPALDQALTCICHVGTFIHEHATSGKPFPTAHNACLTARCTGFISAVAVSCSSDTSTLLALGLRTVVVAFRVGACAWDVGSLLFAVQDTPRQFPHWTVALAGLSEEKVSAIIEQFAVEKNLSVVARPYVSARISANRCSVSAPPPVLDELLKTTALSKAIKFDLPITAPYHAPHLYTAENVNTILCGVDDVVATTIIPIVSSSTGTVVTSATFRDALRVAVEACLQLMIRSDLIAPGIASHVQHADGFAIRHIATAPDGLALAVQTALSQAGGRSQSGRVNAPDQNDTTSIPNALSTPRAKAKIAILSMSGRFPQAPSMEAFWHVLENGIDTHELALASRWNTRTHVGDLSLKELPKNTSGTGFGCWLHDAAQFDARYFNMSPREAPQVDPAQRLALLTATEALEQAGIVPGRTSSTQKDRVGVYFGSTSNDWMETNSAQNIDTYFIPGGNRAFIPGRINYHFKFSGPSYTIDTACSSSFTALHLACNALWKGEVDTAIVGGTNVLTNPDMTVGLDRGHFLSRTGNCSTFDDGADGYCRGEAVATLVLKRLDDAVADKDPVQACILAIATNHSAEAASITRPHVGAQQDLFASVLADAGVKHTDISYCEMHGTGTQAGDAGETTSVLQSLAPIEPPNAVRKQHQPLYIGAAKSNVGHGEAAAGVTSLAKVLLMLKKSTIPPHCGIKTKINHKLPDLPSRNTAIAMEAVSWPRPVNGKRQVLLNNFSAAGGNTALILEDAPEVPTLDVPDIRQCHLVAVSAKTPASLENNVKNMLAWLDEKSDASNLTLARLSYTSTARRIHHPHRVMINATSLDSVKASLRTALDLKKGSSRPKGTPRFVFAFTGQGAQYAGMGADLFAQFTGFRADISRYDQICRQLNFPPVRQLFEDPTTFCDATPTTLQLAMVCFQMALYRMWVTLGVTPSAVVGHSLGEYAALYAASVLTQADVINIVGSRAQLLEKHCEQGSHTMLAVRSNAEDLEAALGPSGLTYELSCHNGRESVVLGGTKSQIETIRPTLQRSRMSNRVLEVPYAYHTSQVEPILASLAAVARGVHFAKPAIPVISPAFGTVLTQSEDFGSDFIVKHCRNKVNMLGALQAARQMSLLDEKMMGIELGPEPVVIKMVKEVAGPAFQTFASSRKDEPALNILASALSAFYTAGTDVKWTAYHADFPSAQVVLELPAYAWDLKEYWIQYVNDWSLRKGDAPLVIERTTLEGTCIHKVVSNSLGVSGGELLVEADLSREDLHPMVQGHKVYGVPLCTPSVYADIALTIGEYAKQFSGEGSTKLGVEIANMNIQSALVATSDGKPQMLRTHASYDAKQKSLYCTFSTLNDAGKVKEQHSNCLIKLFDVEAARTALKSSAPAIKSRISILQLQLNEFGNTFRYSKAMIYKMVGQLADFDPKYRALEEITLDSDALEALGRVNFTKVSAEGKFHTNPAYIDALSQLGGFVMNGNEGVDLDKELFVNHGWASLKLLEAIDPTKTYTTHVKMTEGTDKLWTGDITILDGEAVVGVFGGVALQGVPKRLMSYIVHAASKRTNGVAPRTAGEPQTQRVTAPEVVSAVVKTTTKQLVTQAPVEDRSITTAISIISQESGVEAADLTDDTSFDDIGVDSLLGIMVSSRIRDELGIDVDSAAFLEVRTVGSFKTFLRGLTGTTEQFTTVTKTVTKEITPTELRESSFAQSAVAGDSFGVWTNVLAILAEESGIDVSDLTGDTYFSDIGVDSLLSLVVVSRLRDEFDLDLPEQSLFIDYPTVASLKARITGCTRSPSVFSDSDATTDVPSVFSPSLEVETTSEDFQPLAFSKKEALVAVAEVALTPLEKADPFMSIGRNRPSMTPSRDSTTSLASITEILPPVKPAWSIVLQGSPRNATKRLFLFPDGCGAATSYLQLPTLSSSTAVIAFNSPFMKNPHDMADRQLDDIVASYVESLQRHQPHGPYHLAGWSAGGVLAYAVAQELMATGEEIATLTLIDSPPPTDGLDRLPRRFFDHCSAVGIFGGEMSAINPSNKRAKLPEWLMPHFEATIELLHDYCAPPMPLTTNAPKKINLIWAGGCAFGGKYAPLPPASMVGEDTEGMKFLTEQRTDFGPDKWTDLFPGRHIDIDVVEGEHHFSMMRGKGAQQLGGFLRKTLGLLA
ncbi:non-reducing polyketide synthase elcA-like protein [Parastagonospora nodorum]|nr:non-reducing polyketide synthase elcA-like protein [Parastagonospora nodorum]